MPPIPRLYLPVELTPAGRITPSADQLHYLTRVMRLGAGASLLLFNGQGGEWRARLENPHPPGLLVLESYRADSREASVQITLVHGLAKPAALELAVQKCTELGVAAYVPLLTRRSVPRPRESGRNERWQRIALEAAEQCGRTRLPVIHPVTDWQRLGDHLPSGPRYLCWEQTAGIESLRKAVSQAAPLTTLTLLIGPEGGLEADEVWQAQDQHGFKPVALGPRILRTETAAITALAAVLTLVGDLA